jgi:hypothetical protein
MEPTKANAAAPVPAPAAVPDGGVDGPRPPAREEHAAQKEHAAPGSATDRGTHIINPIRFKFQWFDFRSSTNLYLLRIERNR